MKKNKRSDEEKLNSFIMGVVNAKMITVELATVLAVDTTAIPTLKEINQETREDFSQNGRILYASSQRLLEVYEKAREEYSRDKDYMKGSVQEKIHRVIKLKEQLPKQKVSKITVNLGRQLEKRTLPQNYNDQNHNTLNIERKVILQGNNDKKTQIHEKKLTQIIRPQYKKKINIGAVDKRQKVVIDDELLPNQMRTNRTYVTESEDSDDIPILKNQIKSHRDMTTRIKNGSVSPKHQGRNHQSINNISRISKNFQTQTDHSFEIDLQSMGIVPQVQQKGQRIGFYNPLSKDKQAERALQSMKVYGQNAKKKKMQGQIQEQQPWECDEQQIEEEIRQINERLSHRAYNSQRAKTEYDITRFDTKTTTQNDLQRNYEQPRKKQTKTVRLSLTPVKNKSVGKVHANKKEIHQLQGPKTPTHHATVQDKKNIQNKYQINYPPQPQSPIEIQCTKWKKPQKGLISLQIQKQMKNR